MLSKKAKYAIRSLIHLGRHYGKGPVLISSISTAEKIPKKFLEVILLELRNSGILTSKMGKGGGYYLRKPPEEINLAQILRLIDGPIAYTACVSLNYYEKCEDCKDETTCGIRQVMLELRDASLKILQGTTLAHVIENEGIVKI